jgi:hypothetical protein
MLWAAHQVSDVRNQRRSKRGTPGQPMPVPCTDSLLLKRLLCLRHVTVSCSLLCC